MNERILELAFKLFNEDDQSEPGTYIQLNVEKFAELIINECAGRIDDLITCDDDGNQILECDDVKTELLEHFGVEE